MLFEYECDSWEHLQEQVRLLNEEVFPPDDSGFHHQSPFLYRGQANSAWALDTTLERAGISIRKVSDYYRAIAVAKSQIESFTDRRWDGINFPEIQKLFSEYDRPHFSGLPGYDYLVHLRHHGFPSPLLDWTRSLPIAAFFACQEPKGDCVAVYAYQEYAGVGKLGSSNASQIRVQGHNVRTHPRHFLQQAEYTLCWHYLDGEWQFAPHGSVFDQNPDSQDRLWRFNLPASEGSRVLRELDRFNINAFSLFQSEESLMSTLARRVLR